MRVFVYGTLRRGKSNHAQMKGARFVGAGRTLPRWQLVDVRVATRTYKALAAGDEAIDGEVFEVDDAHLARLDRFEGRNYVRVTIELEDGNAGAWIRK